MLHFIIVTYIKTKYLHNIYDITLKQIILDLLCKNAKIKAIPLFLERYPLIIANNKKQGSIFLSFSYHISNFYFYQI